MTAPITGANNKIDGGIGRETARQLFAAGMLMLARRRSETKARLQEAVLSGGEIDDEWEHFLGNDKLSQAFTGN
jgi:NAD(P)-dependent dehydrogenase (short-subunit alcohol dehydrogenase family)